MASRLSCLAGVLVFAAALLAAEPGAFHGPVLKSVMPSGIPRGTVTDITLHGSGLDEPLAGWLSAAGRVTLFPGDTTGKDSTKIRARIELSAGVPIGLHRFRLATAAGLSNFLPICVDVLPEVQKSTDNHAPATAIPLPIPCVVSGRADPETSDFFKITVGGGQRISFEILGRRLGGRLDPFLRICDLSGRPLPHAYSDDAPGLQSDARLTHVFASAGEYLVEVRDTTNRGGSDFPYRLRIGDFPCANTPLPAAIKRGSKTAVNFAGPYLEGVAPVEVQAPSDPGIESMSVAPVGPSGLSGWPVPLLLSDHDEQLAADNIGTLGQAQPLNPPCGVTGRFLRKGQKDHFVVAAKKGQRFLITAQTAEIQSPAEVYLTVRDGSGSELIHTDPNHDPAMDFTAPADGNYFIVAEHLNYAFGPAEVYRLIVTPPTPGFELSLASDGVATPLGQTALIPVATLSRREFGGPIELSVVGPHGLSGSVTVPAGVQVLPATVDQPAPPLVAQLPIHASAEMAPGVYEIKVMAKAVADGKVLVAFASTKSAVQAQMGGLSYPPREWLRGVGVGVLPKPPFSLAALWERPQAVRGLGNRLVIVATRDAGFDGEISLAATGLPAGVTAASAKIFGGQAAATMAFKLDEKAGLGSFPFMVVGRARQADRAFMASLVAPSLSVEPPFELKVEPNPVSVEAGGKATFTVTAIRKGGYTGPIGLEPRNLPAQVTAARATIGPGNLAATITLAAAAGAPLGSRGDVDILGAAPLGNQQSASPAFTVRVQSPPAALGIKLDPAIVTIKAGGKGRVKVSVERRFFTGPVSLTIEGLPAKVTAAAMTLPADQSNAEIELVAAADAAIGKGEATVVGKAAAAASAKLTVQVEK